MPHKAVGAYLGERIQNHFSKGQFSRCFSTLRTGPQRSSSHHHIHRGEHEGWASANAGERLGYLDQVQRFLLTPMASRASFGIHQRLAN
jgi:hypothetical protein